MTNFSDLFSSGGNSAEKKWLFFTSSTTFTPPANMDCIVHVIGGSGSGASVVGVTQGIATGGGAGGHAQKRLTLAAGVTYTLTIGAGGAGLVNVTSNGNAGGASSFSGAGITTLTANGGGGGVQTTTVSAGAAGGAGGTAAGGDYNLTGGRGGNIAAGSSGSTVYFATGGGAISVMPGFGPFNGGDITGTVSSGNPFVMTAGAGIGESAPSFAAGAINSDINVTYAGAGGIFSGYQKVAFTLSNFNILGMIGTIGAPNLNASFTTDAIPSAGCGGTSQYNGTNSNQKIYPGGIFAGGGSHCATSSGTCSIPTLKSPISGGGGANVNAAGSATLPPGGNGLIILEVLS